MLVACEKPQSSNECMFLCHMVFLASFRSEAEVAQHLWYNGRAGDASYHYQDRTNSSRPRAALQIAREQRFATMEIYRERRRTCRFVMAAEALRPWACWFLTPSWWCPYISAARGYCSRSARKATESSEELDVGSSSSYDMSQQRTLTWIFASPTLLGSRHPTTTSK